MVPVTVYVRALPHGYAYPAVPRPLQFQLPTLLRTVWLHLRLHTHLAQFRAGHTHFTHTGSWFAHGYAHAHGCGWLRGCWLVGGSPVGFPFCTVYTPAVAFGWLRTTLVTLVGCCPTAAHARTHPRLLLVGLLRLLPHARAPLRARTRVTHGLVTLHGWLLQFGLRTVRAVTRTTFTVGYGLRAVALRSLLVPLVGLVGLVTFTLLLVTFTRLVAGLRTAVCTTRCTPRTHYRSRPGSPVWLRTGYAGCTPHTPVCAFGWLRLPARAFYTVLRGCAVWLPHGLHTHARFRTARCWFGLRSWVGFGCVYTLVTVVWITLLVRLHTVGCRLLRWICVLVCLFTFTHVLITLRLFDFTIGCSCAILIYAPQLYPVDCTVALLFTRLFTLIAFVRFTLLLIALSYVGCVALRLRYV